MYCVPMALFFRSQSAGEHQRPDGKLLPAKHVVSTAHGSRTVLLDSRSGHYYGLDEVGSRIWNLAEAGFPPDSIAEQLAQEYDAPPERLRRDVDSFITELKSSRLLVDQ
jgi:hypothetical protein